jgi:hypothetical protein
MTKYWSYVATPLFFGVISFGLFTLFTADDIQLVGKNQVRSAVSNINENDKGTSGKTPLAIAATARPEGDASTEAETPRSSVTTLAGTPPPR